MKNAFITNIQIKNIRHLNNLLIPLSTTERKHLILTGRNGSGKTSTLEALKTYLQLIETNEINNIIQYKSQLQQYQVLLTKFEAELKSTQINATQRAKLMNDKHAITTDAQNKQKFLDKTDAILSVEFSDLYALNELFQKKQLILAYFDAKRLARFNKPSGVQKISFKEQYKLEEKVNPNFVQYLVNMRYDKLDAKDLNELDTVRKIDNWFNQFTQSLKQIFGDNKLQLVFDRAHYNFQIALPNRTPFDLNTLSDGYSSVISILTELILRMDSWQTPFYDVQGIVLIDEIETHLHIELQKQILPFLTRFFPKVQFIVTTHSPFVLTSLPNAVIYDLEKQSALEDLTGYTVEAIVEGYFESDKYSEPLKLHLAEYEQLMAKNQLSPVESVQLQDLDKYFNDFSYLFAPELATKIKQIQLAKRLR
jgi:predicted ATP-binding protein involved in virulence